jgi:peroxiredoxin
MRPEALARAHLSARNFGLAESVAREAVAKNADQLPPLAAQVEILHAVGKTKEAQDAYRKLVPLARNADPNLPVMQRLAAITTAGERNGPARPDVPTGHRRRHDPSQGPEHPRPLDLGTLCRRGFTVTDTKGKPWSLADHKGRNVVLLFFLGGKCAHCMQQLQVFGKEFEALKALNTDLVALSTDDLEATKALEANADGIKFAMPLLPDPKLHVFKSYHAFDDFEGAPAARDVSHRCAGRGPVSADLRRPLPGRRFHQDRGRADSADREADEARRRSSIALPLSRGVDDVSPLCVPDERKPDDLERGRALSHRLRPLEGKPSGSLVVHEIYRASRAKVPSPACLVSSSG